MKRLLFIASFAILFCCSCKKTYTCQCIDNTTGVGTTSFTVEASSTSDAESNCSLGSDQTQTCSLSN